MKLNVYGDVPKDCPKCGCSHFTPKFKAESDSRDLSLDPDWTIQSFDVRIIEYLAWLCDRCKYCVGLTATRDATPPTDRTRSDDRRDADRDQHPRTL